MKFFKLLMFQSHFILRSNYLYLQTINYDVGLNNCQFAGY